MHGLILKANTDNVHVKDIPGGQEVTGIVHAGDFGGHWLSKTDLDYTSRLTAEAVDASIVARQRRQRSRAHHVLGFSQSAASRALTEA